MVNEDCVRFSGAMISKGALLPLTLAPAGEAQILPDIIDKSIWLKN